MLFLFPEVWGRGGIGIVGREGCGLGYISTGEELDGRVCALLVCEG